MKKLKVGERVKFYAFIERVGVDEGMRDWETTGIIKKIEKSKGGSVLYTINPDDKEFLACGPRKLKEIFRSNGEVIGAAATLGKAGGSKTSDAKKKSSADNLKKARKLLKKIRVNNKKGLTV